ncbi:hypothetical protein SOVF_104040, partial [Spinacia oleracea]
MSVMNNVSENTALETNNEVVVPVTCSCAGRFYQANTTYVVQINDSYYTITSNIFSSLTTCNAIQTQKLSPNIIDIFPDERLTIPLRCACPTRAQVGDGIRYLVSFVIYTGDNVGSIATRFGADVGQTLEANDVSEQDSVIYSNTTFLVPLQNPPNTTDLVLLGNESDNNRSSHIAV